MRSTFFGLNTALRALQAQRLALDVTAHNVANANTTGYSRQEAVMAATEPFTVPQANRDGQVGQIGTGVTVSAIRRVRDEFLDRQIRSQVGVLGNWETSENYLQQVEWVFNEPSDTGLTSLLGKMWGSWQDLSASPDSYASKADVVQNATVLADVIKRDSDQLSSMRTQVGEQIDIKIDELNTYLQKIADLNSQIQKVEVVGDQANDLSDQRDGLLDDLAKSLPVSYQEQPVAPGSQLSNLVITLDGRTLVDGGSYFQLRAETNADGTISVKSDDGDGDLTNDPVLNVKDGEMSGLLEVHDRLLNPAAATLANPADSLAWRLDRLAAGLISQVNNAYDPTGAVKFFAGSSASDIAVQSTFVNDPGALQAGSSGEAGDNSIALAVAHVQDQIVDFNGDGTGDCTVGQWYQQLITKLGIDSWQAQGMSANQKLLVDHLKTSRESVSGVSLDEESTNMIRFQRAYEGAARVMTAMDEMLDTLVNRMGVVGRS